MRSAHFAPLACHVNSVAVTAPSEVSAPSLPAGGMHALRRAFVRRARLFSCGVWCATDAALAALLCVCCLLHAAHAPIECPGPFARVVVAPRLCCPPGPVLALRVRRPTSQRRRRRAHSAPPRACLCPPRRALEPRCRACTSCAAGAAARQDEAVRRPRVRARSHCHRRSCATEYARNLLRNCAHPLLCGELFFFLLIRQVRF